VNIDSTRLFLDEALAICRKLNNDTTYILIAAGMQDYFGRIGEKELALKYLNSARKLTSPQSVTPRFRSFLYVGFYFIHYWSYTQYDSSVYHGLLTVDLAANPISIADRSSARRQPTRWLSSVMSDPTFGCKADRPDRDMELFLRHRKILHSQCFRITHAG
jgi:hypothetical protein